jgi:DNA-binding CsgD family transcriptional regulator
VLGTVTAWSGDFAATASLIAETDSIAATSGIPFPPFIELRLLALQGKEAEASALIGHTIERADGGQGISAINAHWAAAVLYNGLGRYDKAAVAARQATSDPFVLFGAMWSLPELVEAAARGGDFGLAGDALERLGHMTQPCGTDLAVGIEARCRALLLGGAAAEDLYREAIDRLSRTQIRTEVARTHLVYGEWLRREGQRVEARKQLRTAHEMLTSIGMEAFAERAHRELIATGEKLRRRRVETRDELTPQEAQIARLARDGRTNREVAGMLFLSPRTVEWHLSKALTKLGISSRNALHIALPREGGAPLA